jgi:hypothetical protein
MVKATRCSKGLFVCDRDNDERLEKEGRVDQAGGGAVASSMRNLVMKGASCDHFAKLGILVERFAYWHYLGSDNPLVVGGNFC